MGKGSWLFRAGVIDNVYQVLHCLRCLVQEGAKIFVRFNNLLPDSYESVKAIARRAVFSHEPTYADILENAAATTGPGGHWDRAMA